MRRSQGAACGGAVVRTTDWGPVSSGSLAPRAALARLTCWLAARRIAAHFSHGPLTAFQTPDSPPVELHTLDPLLILAVRTTSEATTSSI